MTENKLSTADQKALKSLRPFVMNWLKEKRIKKYKQVYNQKNGQQPPRDHINYLVQKWAAEGTIKQETDEIIEELKEEIKNKQSNFSLTWKLLESFFGLGMFYRN